MIKKDEQSRLPKTPTARHFYKDERPYSVSFKGKENPVIFTLNPDFTITASEKGSLSSAAPKMRVKKKEESDCQTQLTTCKTALEEAKRAVK